MPGTLSRGTLSRGTALWLLRTKGTDTYLPLIASASPIGRNVPHLMLRAFKLTIAYEGTDFVGWQVQPNGQSIQSIIESAIEKFSGQKVKVTGSGRTDAGVHAIAQVASFQLESWNRPAADLRRAINRFLPDTIVVRDSVEVPLNFHPIHDAIGKRYRYQLLLGRVRDPFAHRHCWHLGYKIDLVRIEEAASRMLGRRDFVCFQASGSDRKTTVRDLRACDIFCLNSPTSDSARVDVEVEADGFLYNMVRNIVGSLIEVGRGKRSPEWIDEILKKGDRRLAGQTAPAQGLFMLWVDYPQEIPHTHGSTNNRKGDHETNQG